MNTNTNEEKITIISSEIANELMTIGEHLKNRMGINLTNEQVIQHLIHTFKMMYPQGMYQQPNTSFPGQTPFVSPHPTYPTGTRWANQQQPTGLSYEEVMQNQTHKKFNPGPDDNFNTPVNKK